MLWVFQDVDEPIVSAYSATVLWWATAFAVNADRILNARFGVDDYFNKQFVLPVVAKIVGVYAFDSFASKGTGDESFINTLDAGITGLFVILVSHTANHKPE